MKLDLLTRTTKLAGAGMALAALVLGSAPASALTAKECSDKYNAAKAAGTLAGKSWNAFRKSECAAGATAAPAADAAKQNAAKTAEPAAAPAKSAAKAVKAAAPAASGAPSFPTGIAAAYAKEKPAVGRRKTCLDQYRANKAANALGGMKWIQKGGGYYSECNKRLKGN